MQKHIIVLVLFFLVGCSTAFVTHNKEDTIQDTTPVLGTNDLNSMNISKPKQKINFEPTTIYEMLVEAKAYQEKEEKGVLSVEEEKKWNTWKNKYSYGEGEYTHKITGKRLSIAEVITISWSVANEFTWEEIDWVLELGIYKDNPYCEKNLKVFKIFQTISPESALVLGCKDRFSLDYCPSNSIQLYAYVSPNDELLYDGKTIELKQEECAMIAGTATYITNKEGRKTVPIIVPEQKRIHKKRLTYIENIRKKYRYVDLASSGNKK